MKYVKLSVSGLVLLGLVVVFAGCAKPPDAERQAAKAAMDTAVSVGADKYAVTDLSAAKKIWDTAESQMKGEKYKEAKQSYIDAKAAFEKAAAAGEAGKKAVTDQANAAMTAIEGALKTLEATAKKMEKKLKEKKEAWKTDAQAISEGLGKAKEMIAADPAGAKAKLDELKARVDKWENTFKEMAAAPPKPEAAKKKKK
jgi:PBP1b-binding outer membrane lipoprotein LpoB